MCTVRITPPPIRKLCPKCGKRLVPPGGKGPRMWWCIECDNPDPLKSALIKRWIEGSLRPLKG